MAALSDIKSEVSNLNNQVRLQNVPVTERRRDSALMVLAVCAIDDPEGRV